MRLICLFLIIAVLYAGCGTNSAEDELKIRSGGIFEKIEGLEDSKMLVLASSNIQPSASYKMQDSAPLRECKELGDIKDGVYTKINTGNARICFSEIRKWGNSQNKIYGKYRLDDPSSDDTWFITDENGNVHHLPKAPVKGEGFKNGHTIKKMNEKPVYLDILRRLVAFNMEDNTEEILINTAVGNFVILPKNDGDHIFYTDIYGGQRLKPDSGIDRIPEIDLMRFFFRDSDGDLGYLAHNGYFKRIEVNEDGTITDRNASAVPEAYAEWINNPYPGSVMPTGPVFGGSMESCDRSGNLVICRAKSFVTGGRERDLKEINWCDFGHCSWDGGFDVVKTCLNDSFIYFYSPGKLTQINHDFQRFEHILLGEQIIDLACTEGSNLLIRTLSQVYQLDTDTGIKTVIPQPVTEFIQ